MTGAGARRPAHLGAAPARQGAALTCAIARRSVA
ncbi:uncharacterized protein SOCE26_046030 [Sorangium cellulosum]|uniref:Uncharacterized protein n=1 Tax=Sorangium cellulosum TaxID=56 RepID=A0A2L0EV29_SORCE|nr:uncharacterized protein SOCE26_046030 [Sorangium cellulosum]